MGSHGFHRKRILGYKVIPFLFFFLICAYLSNLISAHILGHRASHQSMRTQPTMCLRHPPTIYCMCTLMINCSRLNVPLSAACTITLVQKNGPQKSPSCSLRQCKLIRRHYSIRLTCYSDHGTKAAVSFPAVLITCEVKYTRRSHSLSF